MDEVVGRSKARRQLQRDLRFIESLLEGCDRLESIFDEALDRFDNAMKRRHAEDGT